MNAFLPTVPNLVFTVLEPLSLVAGAVGAVYDPDWFVAQQIAFSTRSQISENARVVTLQLGSIYFLLALIGLAVLPTTREPKVVRNYLVALAIADVTHLMVTYRVLKYSRFTAFLDWNAMAYGNILVTALLFLTRVLYLSGAFGLDRDIVSSPKTTGIQRQTALSLSKID